MSQVAAAVQRIIAPISEDLLAVDREVIDDLQSDIPLIKKISDYIVTAGGKQYTVAVGDKVKVETLPGDVGSQIKLVEVLAVKNDEGLKLGNPTIPGAFVTATVLSEGRHEKVRIFKFRRRKHSMKSAGHRQNYTELKIDEISA